MRNPIIAALDLPSPERALSLAAQIAPVVGGFKIGSELFATDEYLIAAPNLGLGAPNAFDSRNVDVKDVLNEAGWNYMFYLGGTQPVPNTGVGLARSRTLSNWEKKYAASFGPGAASG